MNHRIFDEYYCDFDYLQDYHSLMINAGDLVFLKHALGGYYIMHAVSKGQSRADYEAERMRLWIEYRYFLQTKKINYKNIRNEKAENKAIALARSHAETLGEDGIKEMGKSFAGESGKIPRSAVERILGEAGVYGNPLFDI